MNFKKHYRIMSFGPMFVLMLILDIIILIGIFYASVIGSRQGHEGWILGTIVFSVLLFFAGFLTLEFSLYISIDKDKIEFKGYRGTIVKFNMNDISLIRIKPAFKGDLFFEIHGTPANSRTKKTVLCRGEGIGFPASRKNIEIVKHFVPDTIPWDIKN